MTQYTCRPMTVDAFKITHVSHHLIGHHVVTLDNGEVRKLPFVETARRKPEVGGYLIRMFTPVYEYIESAANFEKQYEVTPAENNIPLPIVTAPETGLIGVTAPAADTVAYPIVEEMADGSVKTTTALGQFTIAPAAVPQVSTGSTDSSALVGELAPQAVADDTAGIASSAGAPVDGVGTGGISSEDVAGGTTAGGSQSGSVGVQAANGISASPIGDDSEIGTPAETGVTAPDSGVAGSGVAVDTEVDKSGGEVV